MGLFDFFWNAVSGQGAAAASNVTASQPTTSTGTPYSTPAPSPTYTTYQTQQAQQQQAVYQANTYTPPQPVQQDPIRSFFQNTPILSSFYQAGAQYGQQNPQLAQQVARVIQPAPTYSQPTYTRLNTPVSAPTPVYSDPLRNFFATTPVLSSVYRAGEQYGAQHPQLAQQVATVIRPPTIVQPVSALPQKSFGDSRIDTAHKYTDIPQGFNATPSPTPAAMGLSSTVTSPVAMSAPEPFDPFKSVLGLFAPGPTAAKSLLNMNVGLAVADVFGLRTGELQKDIDTYSGKVASYNTRVAELTGHTEAFQKQADQFKATYGGRELPPTEYAIALQQQATLKAQAASLESQWSELEAQGVALKGEQAALQRRGEFIEKTGAGAITSWLGGMNQAVSQQLFGDKAPVISNLLQSKAAKDISAKWVSGIVPTAGATHVATTATREIMGLTREQLPSPADILSADIRGGLHGYVEEPVTTAAYTGVGLALGGATRVGGALLRTGTAVGGIEWIASKPIVGKVLVKAGGLATKYGPTAIGGLYAADVATRSLYVDTSLLDVALGKAGEMRTPLSAAETFGRIRAVEAVPMIGGGVIGYHAPEIARTGLELGMTGYTAARFSAAEIRSRMPEINTGQFARIQGGRLQSAVMSGIERTGLYEFPYEMSPITTMEGRITGWAKIYRTPTTAKSVTPEGYYGEIKAPTPQNIRPDFGQATDLVPYTNWLTRTTPVAQARASFHLPESPRLLTYFEPAGLPIGPIRPEIYPEFSGKGIPTYYVRDVVPVFEHDPELLGRSAWSFRGITGSRGETRDLVAAFERVWDKPQYFYNPESNKFWSIQQEVGKNWYRAGTDIPIEAPRLGPRETVIFVEPKTLPLDTGSFTPPKSLARTIKPPEVRVIKPPEVRAPSPQMMEPPTVDVHTQFMEFSKPSPRIHEIVAPDIDVVKDNIIILDKSGQLTYRGKKVTIGDITPRGPGSMRSWTGKRLTKEMLNAPIVSETELQRYREKMLPGIGAGLAAATVPDLFIASDPGLRDWLAPDERIRPVVLPRVGEIDISVPGLDVGHIPISMPGIWELEIETPRMDERIEPIITPRIGELTITTPDIDTPQVPRIEVPRIETPQIPEIPPPIDPEIIVPFIPPPPLPFGFPAMGGGGGGGQLFGSRKGLMEEMFDLGDLTADPFGFAAFSKKRSRPSRHRRK